MQDRLTRMRQFQPHGVSITLYRTQITPCHRKQTFQPVLLTLRCPIPMTPIVQTAQTCQSYCAPRPMSRCSSHHLCPAAMDHLSRSVLSFRLDIAMHMSLPGRAYAYRSNIAGMDPAYGVGQCEHCLVATAICPMRCGTKTVVISYLYLVLSNRWTLFLSVAFNVVLQSLPVSIPLVHHDRRRPCLRSSYQCRL